MSDFKISFYNLKNNYKFFIYLLLTKHNYYYIIHFLLITPSNSIKYTCDKYSTTNRPKYCHFKRMYDSTYKVFKIFYNLQKK